MSTARYAARPMVHGQAHPRSSAPGQSGGNVHQFHAPGPPTARSTYPKFLSVQETALLQVRWASRGLLDSFRWDIVARTVARCVLFLLSPSLVASLTLRFLSQRCRNPCKRVQVPRPQLAVSALYLCV